MGFIEELFSFIPLLMIVLFVMRIVKNTKKDKGKRVDLRNTQFVRQQRTKPDIPKENSSEKAEKTDKTADTKVFPTGREAPGQARIPTGPSPPPDRQVSQAVSPEAANSREPFASPQPKQPQFPPDPAPQQKAFQSSLAKPSPVKQQALSLLAAESEPSVAVAGGPSAIERLNRLPELKKAVMWSEILGPPKSLSQPE